MSANAAAATAAAKLFGGDDTGEQDASNTANKQPAQPPVKASKRTRRRRVKDEEKEDTAAACAPIDDETKQQLVAGEHADVREHRHLMRVSRPLALLVILNFGLLLAANFFLLVRIGGIVRVQDARVGLITQHIISLQQQ